MKMNNSLLEINSKLDNFQSLKSNRKKPMGLNTSRSKLSVSNARINMRKFKPVMEEQKQMPNVVMADIVFEKQNDEYF